METKLGITMYLQLIGIVFIGYTFNVRGYEQFSSENCVTKGTLACSQYIVCTEDVDQLYPGKMTTLVHDVYIPRGLTQNASIYVLSPNDMSVIITRVDLAVNTDSVSMTIGVYSPKVTKIRGKHVGFSDYGSYAFGDIDCKGTHELIDDTVSTVSTISTDSNNSSDSINGATSTTSDSINGTTSTTSDSINGATSTTPSATTTAGNVTIEDPCTYCLAKLEVDYMMANIADVPDNSTRTVTAELVSVNVTLEVATMLVLRPIHNKSKTSEFTIDVPDSVEFAKSSGKSFQLQAVFPNPLSAYKLEFNSPESQLRIASVRIISAGKHIAGFITITTGSGPDAKWICSGGPDTRIMDFGYLPNTGAHLGKASTPDDIVTFKVILLMKGGAVSGKTYPLHIDLEEDFVVVMNSTTYFNATSAVPTENIIVRKSQSSSLLPKSGSGKAALNWNIPPLSSGNYKITASTKRFAGSGGDGLMIAGIDLAGFGSNLPCVPPSKHWKQSTGAVMHLTNIPYSTSTSASSFGFNVLVIALPHVVEADSSHEITATLTYPGEGSPKSFKFYFNITNEEIVTAPNQLKVLLNEKCRSITQSTEADLILDTSFGRKYGRLFVELPMPTGPMGQSFVLCNFGNIKKGHNILGQFYTTITRREDGMIDKVLVEISPLTNIFFASQDGITVNYVTLNMVVTFIDQSLHINNLPMSFEARVISNNKTIWAGELPITKPSIEYHPDFVVLTQIIKTVGNPQNIWYHYSRNGSYYHREALAWNGGNNVFSLATPKVISYFYFSTNPCSVICNVSPVWRPLRYYVTIVKDDHNVMLRLLPYALDQDLDTCFDLPVPGDSPSMLWLRFIRLSLFGVTSKKFAVHIIGEGIECARIGLKHLHVGASGPAYDDKCSIESDIVFCKLVYNNTNATITQCDFECECVTVLQCSNVHIVMQNTNKDVGRLCEVTMNDVV